MATLEMAFDWFDAEGGEIAIFDATNSTAARRARVVEAVAGRIRRTRGEPISVVFLESLCDDRRVLEANMRTKVRNSPDFASMDEAAALDDLRRRIANYEAVYEPVEDHEGAYIKLFNFSSKVQASQIYGRMSKTILPFMMAIHADDRAIYIAALAPRRAEPEYHTAKYFRKLLLGGGGGSGSTATADSVTIVSESSEATTTSSSAQSLYSGLDDSTYSRSSREDLLKLATAMRDENNGLPSPPPFGGGGGGGVVPRPVTPRSRRHDLADKDFGIAIGEWWKEETAKNAQKKKSTSTARLKVFASTIPTAVDAARELSQTRLGPEKNHQVVKNNMISVVHMSALNPLQYCDDAATDADRHTGDWRSFADRRSFNDRGVGGESYEDLVTRLEACVLEVEASVSDVLILTHATPARVFRAYFRRFDVEECMGPPTSPEARALTGHRPTVLEIRQSVGGGWLEKIHVLD